MNNKTMITRIIYFLILVISYNLGSAQYIIQSKGEIPKDFLVSSTYKFKSDISDLKRKEKDKKQFYLESNFTIDNILKSGYVLFNDDISIYLNDVLKKLPLGHLEGKNPRIYLINTDDVNAFATAQGIIFVTVGLIARIENEAQLAFILSHELAHVHHDHSINKFLTNKELDSTKDKMSTNDIGFDSNIFNKSLFSRSLEKEADEEGLKFFSKTNYSVKGVEGIFDILYYSFLPYINKPFEKSFFEEKNYVFPKEKWLDNIDTLSAMKEEEELSTHPSSLSRKKWLNEQIIKETGEKSLFLVSEDRFNLIKKLAQYQLPFIALSNGSLTEAIYNSYTLADQYPDDVELKKVIAYALYYKAMNIPEAKQTNKKGEIQRLYYLIEKLGKNELLILASKYAYELVEQSNEHDELTDLIVQNLFVDMYNKYDSYENFITKSDTSYSSNAFLEHSNKSEFISLFNEGMDTGSDNKNWGNRIPKDKVLEQFEVETRLGIDKVIMVNPFYLSIDIEKENIEFIRSEEKQAGLIEKVQKVEKHSKLQVELLDLKNLTAGDVQSFNDIVDIEYFIRQTLEFSNDDYAPAFNLKKMSDLSEKYKTDYVLYTGIITAKHSSRKKQLWLQSIIIPYIFPSKIPYLFSANYDMLYFGILFDLKTGKKSQVALEYFQHKDYDTLVKAHLYDTFNKIYTD